MAKKKKKSGGMPVPKPVHQEASWPWIALLIGMLALIVLPVAFSFLPKHAGHDHDHSTAPTTSPASGITAPSVDDSKATTMRIVKAGTAYVEKKTTAGTVFSFRRGDKVEVVEIDKDWATIAVEGRGYYLPREMVRGMDDFVIVIDAGHQAKEDIGKEPIGPGSSDEVQKMDVGKIGVETHQPEYEVTTAVANKLKDELETRGYTIYLTRSNSAQDSTSYKDRAEVANKLYADAYISLHTGYSEDATVRGIGALCQTSKNAYISDLYAESKALCSAIVDAMVKTTETQKHDIQETDQLSGINWCRVPVAIIEMGYLSNANDDRLLQGEPYRDKVVQGIANGLDAYFTEDD